MGWPQPNRSSSNHGHPLPHFSAVCFPDKGSCSSSHGYPLSPAAKVAAGAPGSTPTCQGEGGRSRRQGNVPARSVPLLVICSEILPEDFCQHFTGRTGACGHPTCRRAWEIQESAGTLKTGLRVGPGAASQSSLPPSNWRSHRHPTALGSAFPQRIRYAPTLSGPGEAVWSGQSPGGSSGSAVFWYR